jgi:hypothetical protein
LTPDSTSVPHPASFRDPSGFIFRKDAVLYRQVNKSYAPEYQKLMADLYGTLTKKRLLIPHAEVDVSLAVTDEAAYVLRPEPLDFVSYPYEWSFSQFQDAALLTLRVQKLALKKGMILKDASAYNVQFHRGRPVFMDTLSFDVHEPGAPWGAYKQFCQHFLAPLALMSLVDIRLGRMMAEHIDGIPLDLAARMLPGKTRMSPSLGMHIHAQAMSQKKFEKEPDALAKHQRSISPQVMNALVDSLEKAVRKLSWKSGNTEWADYYEATHNYGDEGLDEKAQDVQAFIQQVQPKTVWDLGANTGHFSRLVGPEATTISWDIDPSCVEMNYRRIREEKTEHIVPLLVDLTNPSAGLGWAHRERMSLVERGPVDLVLALGLIHHLCISNNVPFPRIAAFLAEIAGQVILEFIPREDSQVQNMLKSRLDIFANYTLEQLEIDFAPYFRVVERKPIDKTVRTLYLLERCTSPAITQAKLLTRLKTTC